jgi:hypothetical protein
LISPGWYLYFKRITKVTKFERREHPTEINFYNFVGVATDSPKWFRVPGSRFQVSVGAGFGVRWFSVFGFQFSVGSREKGL